MTGRTYAPAESFTLVDVARMVDDVHARNGLECACENQPDGGTWTVDQPTYGAHIAAELMKAGLLK